MHQFREVGRITESVNATIEEDLLTIIEKDFAELNFSTTPVPAALATLSQKQSEVRRLEGEVLDYLASQVGAKEIKFEKIE